MGNTLLGSQEKEPQEQRNRGKVILSGCSLEVEIRTDLHVRRGVQTHLRPPTIEALLRGIWMSPI